MRSVSITVFAMAVTFVAFGQSDRGAITGTVTDPAGAVIAGAPIEAKNTATGGIETRLLQAFSEYSEINNRRAEQLRLAMLASRVSGLEQRILQVEEGLDNPSKP